MVDIILTGTVVIFVVGTLAILISQVMKSNIKKM